MSVFCFCNLPFVFMLVLFFFFFKQKTAYEMRISDWSSDVCSSDLHGDVCPLCNTLVGPPTIFPMAKPIDNQFQFFERSCVMWHGEALANNFRPRGSLQWYFLEEPGEQEGKRSDNRGRKEYRMQRARKYVDRKSTRLNSSH